MLTFLRLQIKWLCFSIQCSPISEMALLFGRFPSLALYFLLVKGQHVDGEKHGALMKWYLQGQTKYSKEILFKCHFVHHKSHIVLESKLNLRNERPERNRLRHFLTFKTETKVACT